MASGTDGNYLQSANVGDTQTYNLIAYAYTNGSAVTSNDVSLYYDGATITTSYAPMGGTGWYKLSGSLTGVASAKSYGVRVKAGKTVYIDEMKLQVGTGAKQTMYVMNSGTGVTDLNVQGLVNGTSNGVATFIKAGTISDSDFSSPTDGLMGYDSLNGRLYIRNASQWSYVAKTAGFQIPDFESEGLEAGDYLIPYVERKMSDGAVHGLYAKWSEVKDQLLMGITARLDAIELRFEEFRTKRLCIEDETGEVCVSKDQLKMMIDSLTPSPTASASAT